MGLGFLLSAPWTEGESDPPEVDRRESDVDRSELRVRFLRSAF